MQLRSSTVFRPSVQSVPNLGDSLVDRSEQLHIIPSTYDIEDGSKASWNQGSDESRFQNADL